MLLKMNMCFKLLICLLSSVPVFRTRLKTTFAPVSSWLFLYVRCLTSNFYHVGCFHQFILCSYDCVCMCSDSIHICVLVFVVFRLHTLSPSCMSVLQRAAWMLRPVLSSVWAWIRVAKCLAYAMASRDCYRMMWVQEYIQSIRKLNCRYLRYVFI